MKDLYIYEKSQMLIMTDSDINDKILYKIFLEHPKRTVYVVDSECNRLTGIITLGNFKRYLRSGKTLVNKNYTAIEEEDENKINNIFAEKEKIMSIPLLGKNGNIIKEYCRESEEQPENYGDVLPIIEQTYKEAALAQYDTIVFMLGGIFDDKTGTVEKIYNETKGKIIILDSLMMEKQMDLQSLGRIMLYDIGTALSNVTRLLCKKYNIDYTWYIKDDVLRLSKISRSLPLYRKVGIIAENKYFSDLFRDNNSVCILNASDLQYNCNRKCYEYIGCSKEYEDLEAIFGVFKISEKSCIFINGRYVPMIVSLGEYYGFDEDIAFNIIPRLQENGIQSIVICSALDEYEEHSSLFNLDIKHRAPTDLYNCKDNFEEEQRKFWRYKGEYSRELRESFNLWQWVDGRFYSHWKDINSKLINYCEGERYTCGNQEDFERTMYLFGPCIVTSSYVSDEDTLGSLLRNRIDSSIYISNRGSLWANINYNMRDIFYKSGDIVIIFARDRKVYELNQIPVHSILDAFLEVPNLQDNMWDLLYHCNSITMKCVADKVYDICMKEQVFSEEKLKNVSIDKTVYFGRPEKKIDVPLELQDWLTEVREYKADDVGKAGAIVMNCNPFTRGHRYLIEKAAKCVDRLYIFVLEENKSFFDFSDRLQMVKLGVADLQNVTVIPSGKYMISSVTLPGYFEKEDNPYGICDAANDLELFAGVIAKEFDIQVRFAGEEPIDVFTRQYNHSMRRILPRYGVEFKEIPRKQSGGEVISASRVRKYMKERKYDEIKKLVLPEVYDYLEKHYFE